MTITRTQTQTGYYMRAEDRLTIWYVVLTPVLQKLTHNQYDDQTSQPSESAHVGRKEGIYGSQREQYLHLRLRHVSLPTSPAFEFIPQPSTLPQPQ